MKQVIRVMVAEKEFFRGKDFDISQCKGVIIADDKGSSEIFYFENGYKNSVGLVTEVEPAKPLMTLSESVAHIKQLIG